MAQAISAISHCGVETTLLAGKLEKRRRKRDTTSELLGVVLGNPTSPGDVLRGRHTKRDGTSLSEVNSNMWMGTISVGTPQQTFTGTFGPLYYR